MLCIRLAILRCHLGGALRSNCLLKTHAGEMPSLAQVGYSFFRVVFQACSVLLPHIHANANELVFPLAGGWAGLQVRKGWGAGMGLNGC
jgi:hypothetical protein